MQASPVQTSHAPRRSRAGAPPPHHGEGTLSEAPRACPSCARTFPADYLVCPHDGSPLGVAANEADPLVGVLLAGSYRLERALARGGMGRLYQASHTRLPRRVAIKVLHEPHARKKETVRRFEREASALARIDDPHVLAVLDFVRTPDGRGAIVTPLLEGEDLQSMLERRGALPDDEAIRIALAMCRGLAAAHAEGIVHRDLKPSNVFLARRGDEPPSVKLLDFGVAKLGDEDMTRTGVVLGTPAYMAPEQASGSSRVDARADVYGVGAVLYRMLSGHLPYEGDDAAHVLARLVSTGPRRLSSWRPVPEALESIVERAMARDPDERFPTAASMGDALAALAETPTSPRGRGGAARPSRAVPRERALSVVLVAVSACAASALLVASVQTAVQALDASTERVEAFALALALVGGVSSFAALAWALGARVRARWQSGAELASLRSRTVAALGLGAATLGALELALLAAGGRTPVLELLALATAALASSGAALGARRPRPVSISVDARSAS